MVEYPSAERLDLVEDLHGHRVADPYRWLEDADDPRTKDWLAAQEALTAAELAALPGREALAARLESLLRAGSVGAPVWRAGRVRIAFHLWAVSHGMVSLELAGHLPDDAAARETAYEEALVLSSWPFLQL